VPTETPVVLTPEPSAEVTEEPAETSSAEIELNGPVIGIDDDQYYRSADDPAEVIVIDPTTDTGV
jgi:hypothetical protein